VDKLPVFLTADYSPAETEHYNSTIADRVACLSEFTFGRDRFVRILEDATILENQSHFRSEEFLILSSMNRFESFLQFVVKHLRGLTKLALIIDQEDYFGDDFVPRLLNSLTNKDSIKVLLVERTLRDASKFEENVHYGYGLRNPVVIQQPFYSSILSLSSLEELYFFPKRDPQIVIANLSPDNDYGGRFLNAILPQLSVFHVHSYVNCEPEIEGWKEVFNDPHSFLHYARRLAVCYRFEAGSTYPKLRELACHCDKVIKNIKDLPNLTTLQINELIFSEKLVDLNISALQNLQSLRFVAALETASLINLNRLPRLESLECYLNDMMKPNEILSGEFQPNWTIKRLLMTIFRFRRSDYNFNWPVFTITHQRIFFPALETLQFVEI